MSQIGSPTGGPTLQQPTSLGAERASKHQQRLVKC
jgi:hypothetical protein